MMVKERIKSKSETRLNLTKSEEREKKVITDLFNKIRSKYETVNFKIQHSKTTFGLLMVK